MFPLVLAVLAFAPLAIVMRQRAVLAYSDRLVALTRANETVARWED